MKKVTIFLLMLIWSFSALDLSAATAGQIAVTIDDLPCVGPRTRSAKENIQKIVGHLTDENVSGTGFVCGDRGNFEAVEPWIKAGLPLGNHTFSHPALSKISVSKFIADIEKNEKTYKDKLNVVLRGGFFRFPFLDHGNSPEKVDQLEKYLKNAQYRLAHVSFDTIDYQFAVEYAKTNNKKLVSSMYIEHLQQCADHFASMSQLLFERQIPLILLIHANELNADLLGVALKSLKRQGWQFISLEDAIKDQVYQPYLYRVPMPKCPGDRNFMNQIALSRGIKVNDISGDAYFKAHWLPMIQKNAKNEDTKDPLEQSRIYTDWFYKNKLAELRDRFSDEMKKTLSLKDFTALRAQISEQFGSEIEILEESVSVASGLQICERVVRYDKYRGPIKVLWALGPANVIGGFFISPVPSEAPSDFLDYQTKTDLRLPFNDLWDTFWGGRKIIDNYHAAYSGQRFAADYLIMQDTTTHSGDGTRNEDYYCFGRQLFAPGNGVIVAAANDIDDNVPGKMNPAQPMGNYVIIDHGNNEFSFMAHFKKESIVVKAGEQVKSGQLLGLCGNSGNSSEAHLHYHLQNKGIFNQGEGLPAQFQNYLADNVEISRGEPVRGQKIQNKQSVNTLISDESQGEGHDKHIEQ